jgi:hypothetical protein
VTAPAFSAISVTAPPSGTSSQAQGSALPVTWTTDAAVDAGQFSIWVVSSGNGWYGGKIVAADGTAAYDDTIDLNVPVDAGYRIFVYYRAAPGDPWSIYGYSAGTVEVTAPAFSTISVTAPATAVSQVQGSDLTVTWTTDADVAAGQFSVWVVSANYGAWFGGEIVAADGTAAYQTKAALNVPVEAGYRIFVFYRAAPADPWGIYAFSAGTVEVTAP